MGRLRLLSPGVLAALLATCLSAGCSKTPTFVDDAPAITAACAAAEDCPGKENECAGRTCVEGACGVSLRDAGYPLAAQTDGDCTKAACDGAGSAALVADDADVPSDGNACTLDLCDGAGPSHAPAPAGDPCGDGLSCDGAGQCAGCTEAAQCGADSPCLAYTCGEGGVCALAYVPSGQGDPGGQLGGDCHRLTCNGLGGVASAIDDADVPVDGNPCTDDVCKDGVASNPKSPAGSPCGGSSQCDGAGSCQGCLHDSDCGQSGPCVTYACQQGGCVTSFVPAGQGDPGGQQPNDCHTLVCDGGGGVASVVADGDVPVDGNLCTQDQCSGGAPSNPSILPESDGSPCTADVCDPATGQTVHPAANDGAQCGACQSCWGGACLDDCGACQYCDAGSNSCYEACGFCEYCDGFGCVYDWGCGAP